jgi:hypothetical protein
MLSPIGIHLGPNMPQTFKYFDLILVTLILPELFVVKLLCGIVQRVFSNGLFHPQDAGSQMTIDGSRFTANLQQLPPSNSSNSPSNRTLNEPFRENALVPLTQNSQCF